jgi:NADPH:quinone reductase-like Zn-dependent oxidoreductase
MPVRPCPHFLTCRTATYRYGSLLRRQLPDGFTLEQGATVGGSAIAAFHVLRNELRLDIPLDPWATGEAYVSRDADTPILLWGGSTMTAYYAIQVGPPRSLEP